MFGAADGQGVDVSNPRKESGHVVIHMTRRDALALGLLCCGGCHHAPSQHFDKGGCGHCDCAHYVEQAIHGRLQVASHDAAIRDAALDEAFAFFQRGAGTLGLDGLDYADLCAEFRALKTKKEPA